MQLTEVILKLLRHFPDSHWLKAANTELSLHKYALPIYHCLQNLTGIYPTQ